MRLSVLALIGAALVAGCDAGVPTSTESVANSPQHGPSSETASPSSSPTLGTPSVDEADRDLFIFASGPDCFSLQVTTGQPFILTFPGSWIVEERGTDGCFAGPRFASSVASVRDDSGRLMAASGDVVRAIGDRVERGDAEWVPVFRVESIEKTDLAVPDALALLFRDPDSPYIRVRDRSPLPPCGLIMFKFAAPDDEVDVQDDDPSGDVRTCVWDAYRAGTGAEYVVHRDGFPDSGYLTRIVRIHPTGEIEAWGLSRHINNEPADWSFSLCEDLEERPSEDDVPAFEPVGCMPD